MQKYINTILFHTYINFHHKVLENVVKDDSEYFFNSKHNSGYTEYIKNSVVYIKKT